MAYQLISFPVFFLFMAWEPIKIKLPVDDFLIEQDFYSSRGITVGILAYWL